jgi:ribosomal protein S18 acetylase RimI-like enzyme
MTTYEVRLCCGDHAPDSFKQLWDDVTTHHAGLRPDDLHATLPTWQGERASLAGALTGLGSGFVVVAEANHRLLGYARVETAPGGLTVWPPTDRIGKLDCLSVTPSVRGQGVGTRLVETVVTELAARGVTIVFVGFWPENTSARRFYEHCGFRADGRGRHRRWCP